MSAINRTVKGPAVVLQLKGGGERYLYRGAIVGDAYLASSVQHAVTLGLVSEVEVPDAAEVAQAEAERVAAEQAEAERVAAEKAEAERIVAEKAAQETPADQTPAPTKRTAAK